MTDRDGGTFIIHYRTIDDGYAEMNIENPEIQANNPTTTTTSEQNVKPGQDSSNRLKTPPPPYQQVNDEAQIEMIRSFLNQEQCLNGVKFFVKMFKSNILLII